MDVWGRDSERRGAQKLSLGNRGGIYRTERSWLRAVGALTRCAGILRNHLAISNKHRGRYTQESRWDLTNQGPKAACREKWQ